MRRKCVRGLELGLKSHSEKKHGDNVIPAALWINPLMHSDISELVLAGFGEPLYISQIRSGGLAGVIIYQEASGVHSSSAVFVLSVFVLFVSAYQKKVVFFVRK